MLKTDKTLVKEKGTCTVLEDKCAKENAEKLECDQIIIKQT